MKHIGRLLIILSAIAAASCAPSPANNEAATVLSSSPATITIKSLTDSTGVTTAALSCGCKFPMQIAMANGETTPIFFIPIEPLSADTTPHHILFLGKAGTPSGNYTAHFSLSAHDDPTNSTLYDTVVVNLKF